MTNETQEFEVNGIKIIIEVPQQSKTTPSNVAFIKRLRGNKLAVLSKDRTKVVYADEEDGERVIMFPAGATVLKNLKVTEVLPSQIVAGEMYYVSNREEPNFSSVNSYVAAVSNDMGYAHGNNGSRRVKFEDYLFVFKVSAN